MTTYGCVERLLAPISLSVGRRTVLVRLMPVYLDVYAATTSRGILNSKLDTLPHGLIGLMVDVCVYGDSPPLTGAV
jgi:hypothetical protein